jgi:hypothetical protein
MNTYFIDVFFGENGAARRSSPSHMANPVCESGVIHMGEIIA